MKVAEKYCCVMIQAARRSCCSQSGSNVLKFGFHMHCHACTYRLIYSSIYVYIFRSNFRKIYYHRTFGTSLLHSVRESIM